MKMKKIIRYTFLLVIMHTYGQELNLPVFTQYLSDNDFSLSPTYAGIGDYIKVRANGLTQWVGIKDAPDNQALYADFRIFDRSGVGLTMFNDKNGNTIQKGFKISFAHHLILNYPTKQYLSFGLSYNINTFRIDINNFNPNFETPIIDPFVTDDRSITNHNFDVGALYRYGGYYFSFNASNILAKKTDEFTGIEPNQLLNYQVYTGLVIKSKKNKKVEFEPSLYYQLFGSDLRSSTDLNFKFRKYNRDGDYYFIGASYRFLNDQFLKPLNIGPMAGITKSKFYFGYSYQLTMNDLSSFNTGTHSITVGINFLQGISNCPCTRSTKDK